MAENGIGFDNAGLWLRLAASGFTLDKVKFGNADEEDVTFYSTAGTLHPEEVGTITIPTQTGCIPLSSLGSFRLDTNPTVIYRQSGKRTISVTAGVLPGYSVSDINTSLENYAKNGLDLPGGYTWATGGVNEENTKSVQSILEAMGLSFILIMATMVVEFSSYRQAAMILSLIPFAISGVFIVFGLTGTPLSFPALIGVMALFGIVVTNAMFIVEKINQNRKEGMGTIHAIADAGRSRLEPILLTSITSILGLIPITLSNPLWTGLGGAIVSGLMFSGGIMLIYIPVVYYTIYKS
jgi:multidrug efflux pump subunit AcrB